MTLKGRKRQTETVAMIDSGATALFLGKTFVKTHGINTFPLRHPIEVHNIDGTLNRAGSITHYARLGLVVDQQETWVDFLITDLGGEDVILGLPWLHKVNPQVDWMKREVRAEEDIPEPESVNMSMGPSTTETGASGTVEEQPPLYCIRAN